VGDLVIVQIVESSSADKEATTEASKDSSIDSSVTNFLGLPINESSVFGKHVEPTVKLSGSTKFTGDGKTSRKGTLSASVTSQVIRVLPSGNYVIKGKKQIRVNDEAQYIVVSGVIRPEDILWNNSIISTKIADLKVDYYGDGIIGDQQSKGLIARVLDKIWPF
jgi:flagellar L-ring protein precursor FlgH